MFAVVTGGIMLTVLKKTGDSVRNRNVHVKIRTRQRPSDAHVDEWPLQLHATRAGSGLPGSVKGERISMVKRLGSMK